MEREMRDREMCKDTLLQMKNSRNRAGRVRENFWCGITVENTSRVAEEDRDRSRLESQTNKSKISYFSGKRCNQSKTFSYPEILLNMIDVIPLK